MCKGPGEGASLSVYGTGWRALCLKGMSDRMREVGSEGQERPYFEGPASHYGDLSFDFE